jgi:hypothetical protein
LVKEPPLKVWKAKGSRELTSKKERSRLCQEKMVPARQGEVKAKDLEAGAGEIVSARNAVKKVRIPGESPATPRNVPNVGPRWFEDK